MIESYLFVLVFKAWLVFLISLIPTLSEVNINGIVLLKLSFFLTYQTFTISYEGKYVL